MPTTNQGRPFFTNFFAAFRAHAALQKSSSPASVAITSSLPSTRLPIPPTSPTSAITAGPARSITTKRSTASLTLSSSPTNSALALSPPQAVPIPTPTFRSSRPLQSPYAAGTPQAPGRQVDSAGSKYYDNPPPNNGATLPQQLSHPQTSCSSSSGPTYPSSPVYGPSPFSQRSRTPSLTRQRTRRGSDSSSEGGFPMSSSYNAGMKGRDTGVAGWDLGATANTAPEKWYIGGMTAQGEERFYKLGLVKRYGSEDRLSLDRLSL